MNALSVKRALIARGQIKNIAGMRVPTKVEQFLPVSVVSAGQSTNQLAAGQNSVHEVALILDDHDALNLFMKNVLGVTNLSLRSKRQVDVPAALCPVLDYSPNEDRQDRHVWYIGRVIFSSTSLDTLTELDWVKNIFLNTVGLWSNPWDGSWNDMKMSIIRMEYEMITVSKILNCGESNSLLVSELVTTIAPDVVASSKVVIHNGK